MQKKAKAWLSLATALALLGGCVFSGSFAALAEEDTYGDKTVIDAIDSAEGWGDADFLRLETSAAGEAFLLGNRDIGFMQYTYSFAAKDLSAYKDAGYLHVRIYLSDASKVTDARAEITSSGEGANQSAAWALGGHAWKNGWNDLYLEASKAENWNSAINWGAANYFRIYFNYTDNITTGIDDLYMCKKGQYPAEPDLTLPTNEGYNKHIPVADTADLEDWSTKADHRVATSPAGLTWLESRTDGIIQYTHTMEPGANFLEYKDQGYLHLWLYVENKELLSGGQAELTSSGFGDSLETGWDLKPYVSKNGWNELFLPVKDAVKTGGDTDFAAVNFFRVYLTYTGTMKTGLMDPTLCLEKAEEEEKPVYGTKLAIDEGTSTGKWLPTGTAANTAGGPEDGAYIGAETADVAVYARAFSPAMDLRRYVKDGFLHIFVYVDNVANVSGGQIELTGSRAADVQEIHWNVKDYLTKNGWNELYLPLAEAIEEGGRPNFQLINYFRVYIAYTGTMKTGITDIYACLEGAGEDALPTDYSKLFNDKKITIDPVEKIADWGNTGIAAKTSGSPVKGTYFESSAKDASNFARVFDPALKLSRYPNGCLKLYVYVEDLSKLTGGQIELTSGGEADKNELHWNVLDFLYQDGWNELYLPMNLAEEQGGKIDLGAVNFFRAYFLYDGAAMRTGIDEIALYGEGTPGDNPETGAQRGAGEGMGLAALLSAAAGVLVYTRRRARA